MSNSLPPFLFVGTAKAGTTSIYNYLLNHPQLFIPKKETFFFLRDRYIKHTLGYPRQRLGENMVLDINEHRKLYEPAGDRVIGEVGTGYLFHHDESIGSIKRVWGDEVRILIILRNPVERAYSGYQHFAKDLMDPLSFEESMQQESSRFSENWDFMWQHRKIGLYSNQIVAFLNAFKHVCVLFYDDLIIDPKQVMNEIFSFIGVDKLDELDTKKKFNPSGEPKSRLIHKLLLHDNPVRNRLKPLIRFILSDDRRIRIREELKAMNLKKYQPMDPSTKHLLIEYYLSDIENLEKLIGRDLSNWKV